MQKLGLASNFFNEVDNVEPIWENFKDIVSHWLVVDTGSTDGTQKRLQQVVNDKLTLVESNMIQTQGYGYSRTKLIELSEGMDWVLIIDGDERMDWRYVAQLKSMINTYYDCDLIWLPRYQCKFIYYDGTTSSSSLRTSKVILMDLEHNPDYQARLIKRTIINSKSKIQFKNMVHEQLEGIEKDFKSILNPLIMHLKYLSNPERKKRITKLCADLWEKEGHDLSYKEAWKKKQIINTFGSWEKTYYRGNRL